MSDPHSVDPLLGRLLRRPDLLQVLMEAVPGAVFLAEYDERQGFLYETAYESPGIEGITGIPPEQLILEPGTLLDLVHPADREVFQETLKKAITDHAARELEYRIRNAVTGEYHRVFERIRSIPGDSNGRSVVLGVMVDVTAHDSLISALSDAEERMRVLVEGTPYLFFYTQDHNADITYVSPSVEKITGYTVEEWKGQRHWFATDNPINQQARRATYSHLKGQAPSGPVQVEIRHADGHPILLEVYEAPIIRDGRVSGIQGVARDITAQQRLQEELANSKKMEAVGRLAAGLAHELNNMLQGILTAAELAQLKVHTPQEAEPWLEKVLSLTSRGRDLISNLLSYSRQQVLQKTRVDLNQIVESAVPLARALVNEGVSITTELTPHPLPVFVDSSQIINLLLNLADNAGDAMPDGGTILIRSRADHAHGTAFLEFSDTGPGLAPEHADKIFEPFFTTKGVGEGSGLGLSSVLGTVEQHGGAIAVDGSPGEGTTFTISLPLSGEAEPPTSDHRPGPRSAGQKTVLLVEDNQDVLEVMAEVLEDDGYHVLKCTELAEARRQLRAGSPVHVVVSDLRLPDGSGAELVDDTELPLILMSGYPLGSLPPEIDNIPSHVTFLGKPFQVSVLEKKIAELFETGDSD